MFEDLDRITIDDRPEWPHQTYAIDRIFQLIDSGCRRILVTSPTGGGKSLIQFKAALKFIEDLRSGVALFASRKFLIEQMCRGLKAVNVPYGVRAANHDGSRHEPFQVCSIQTEFSRVVKRHQWEPHDCGMFIVDEAHMNEDGNMCQSVYKRYIDNGAVKVGFTATPLGLGGGYDELVVAGTNGDLRACGALVPATHFGCSEPDMRHIRKYQIGEEISEGDNVKAIMAPGIVGRVLQKYRELNPQGLPAIGFGPGVAESFGFAEAFVEAGIPAAHIDGDRVWINGEWMVSNEDSRGKLLEMSRTNQVRIVWSRFVLREAVDMPWLRHGIFATVFGSLQSYLQSGGRLLRSCPPVGKDSVTVQDHGGNWWRHGSLNADRNWRLGATDRVMANLRTDEYGGTGEPGDPPPPEPFLCKACNTVLILRRIMQNFMAVCPRCGHEMDFRRRSRPVIQKDGELVEHVGNIFSRRRTEVRPDTHQRWRNYFFRARNGNMTFHQAAGLFYHENGYYPPRTLPLMPHTAWDWYLPVKSVPFERLRPETRNA